MENIDAHRAATHAMQGPAEGGSGTPSRNAEPAKLRDAKSTKRPSYPRHATAELIRELSLVETLPHFANSTLAGPSVDPALLLRKVEVYSDWMSRHDAHPPSLGGGRWVSTNAVMGRIGHAGIKPTPEVRSAIVALGQKHGFSAINGRHNPECQIDRDLDQYAAVISARRKGPPRSAANTQAPCRIGCAHELGCAPIDIDGTAMKRLRMIMAEEESPGDVYYPTPDDMLPTVNQYRNPAVPQLLALGLSKYVDGLPADPLDPAKIDIAAVAYHCRVSVADITRFSEHMAQVEAARGDRPLIPHPAIAERRYTYRELVGYGRAERRADCGKNASPGQASRTSVSALKLFLATRHAGGDLSSIVPHDLEARVQRAILDRPEGAGSGWMAEMRRWIGWNAEVRASKPLPQPFATALRVLCLEAGASAVDLIKATSVTGAVRHWLAGETAPSLPMGPVLEKIDLFLGVPPGTLAGELSDEWRTRRFDASLFELDEDGGDAIKIGKRRSRHTRHLPLAFGQMSDDERRAILEDQHWSIVNQDTDFAKRQAVLSRDRYRLKKKQWPDVIKTTWEGMIPKQRTSVLRRPGEVIPPPVVDANGKRNTMRKDKWRKKTIEHREELLSSLFGYWTRKRKLAEDYVAGFQSRKIDFTPEAGLGIEMDRLHPVLFVFPDLISVFCHWRARRSGMETRGFVNILQLAAEFVRPETGPIWKEDMSEQLIEFKKWWDANPHDTPEGPVVLDIEPFLKNWQVAVEAAYKVLREDLYRVINGKLPKSRDPFMTVDEFVQHKRPLEHYMKGVRCLLDSKPHVAVSRHVHNRRKLMTLILVQTGLRTGTMMLTMSGRDPELREVEDEDGNVSWEILIKPERFKNFDSPFFAEGRPYQFTLEDEDDLYDLLREYLTYSRPYLLKGKKSDSLFVTQYGDPMDEENMRQDYHTITRLYFVKNEQTGTGAIKGAVSHGMHAVRHVIATHIMKVTGDPRLAAHAIQDMPRTAEKHYARFWPLDKLRHVVPVMKRARMAGLKKLAD
ncbi:hypothetical protein M9978_17530 [Sphingomonas sp. MG17]|uniref:Phage integrase family protein n=1 Tax=Sphingomonas tagetis TaxID=2949092 RepID=A0A9X2HUI6_9SPHN|nr:hypothetical protein [Sphingomonas tagetis]MCP3732225.1 hypothetical protein [Sphingomonas tagetis]